MADHGSIEVVVIYADIVGSTKIVNELQESKIPLFYKIYCNELYKIINDFKGFVYKPVGDEVIGIFFIPETGWIPTIDNSIQCISYIRYITKYVISPIAESISLPKIQCRIGADYGIAQIVDIGVEGIKISAEILGNVMNVTAKIREKSKPDEVTIGQNYYEQLHTSYKLICKKINPLIINKTEYNIYHVNFDNKKNN
jgi:class 3 adenylate cyclase